MTPKSPDSDSARIVIEVTEEIIPQPYSEKNSCKKM